MTTSAITSPAWNATRFGSCPIDVGINADLSVDVAKASSSGVARQFHVRAEVRGRKQVRCGAGPAEPETRVPRVAKLMALAIRFDEMIRDRVVKDQAELARLGRVSRARLTQIMDLLSLAPAIQEQLLELRQSNHDVAIISERQLRPMAAISCWRKQLKAWPRRRIT
jgi:hypothetical protein